MYNIGDYVIYKNEVCIVKEIRKKYFNDMDYYILNPIDDNTLKINLPIENKYGLLKNIMTKEEALTLIKNMKKIEILNTIDKNIENEYKKLLSTGNKEDLIKIIKTTYTRNKKRKDDGKKMKEKDEEYFRKAEKLLYNEISISLDMTFDDVKEFIVNKLSKGEKI